MAYSLRQRWDTTSLSLASAPAAPHMTIERGAFFTLVRISFSRIQPLRGRIEIWLMAPTVDGGVNPLKDETARLYAEYALSLLRFGLTLGATQEIAQDAVQEAFLRYFIARREAQGIENPRSWLFRVMRNCVLDDLKSAAVRHRVGLEQASQSPGGGVDPEDQYSCSEVFRSLARRLTPRELECVRLRAEGLRYAEIGEVLGIRCGTVGALLARAHAKVREMGEETRPPAKAAKPETNPGRVLGGCFAS